jgi:Zn-dependent protease
VDYQGLLIFVPVLLFSVIAHEYAHGYAALRQGDDTALMLGRLTWNPIRHIDPVMTIIVPAMLWFLSGGRMLLGGAKPVPVNPRKYRNFKRGDIIVSLAGVATNLVIAIACALLFPLLGILGRAVPSIEMSAAILQAMMVQGLMLNLILIVFNLIPIPPLDGSHVMKYLLPASLSFRYQQVSRYGIIVLIALMWISPGALNFLMTPAFKTFGWTFTHLESGMLPATRQWLAR